MPRVVYVDGRWLDILEQVFSRIYLLRCQMTYGDETCGRRLSCAAVKRSATMMVWLLPAILQIWIDHSSEVEWVIRRFRSKGLSKAGRNCVRGMTLLLLLRFVIFSALAESMRRPPPGFSP